MTKSKIHCKEDYIEKLELWRLTKRMEVEYERETQSSSEEDEILERNVKKVKDNCKERAFS